MAGEGDDHARVDAAGEIRADRHFGPEPFLDGLQQDLFEVVHETARVAALDLIAFIRKIHFPIGALLHHGARPVFPRGDNPQMAARRKELNAFKTGAWAGHGGKAEDMIETATIWASGDHS